ncbi:MAG: hypothetical protein WEA09_09750 [Gemmatimonadota bacterium]
MAALLAFHGEDEGAQLRLRDDLGNDDLIPVARFFRTGVDLPPLEELALQHCRGHVLDIGAGAGAHALLLQKRGMSVSALEPHGELAEMLRQRGVERVLEGTLSDMAAAPPGPPPCVRLAGGDAQPGRRREERCGGGFDTLLLLMNGWGLAGSAEAFPAFLDDLESLLGSGGQILADSTTPAAFHNEEVDEAATPDDTPYPGNVQFQWEFQGRKGAPFPFLFLDPERLSQLAEHRGWKVEILAETDGGAYLSRLTRPERVKDAG